MTKDEEITFTAGQLTLTAPIKKIRSLSVRLDVGARIPRFAVGVEGVSDAILVDKTQALVVFEAMCSRMGDARAKPKTGAPEDEQ